MDLPDADELRIRQVLHTIAGGPDATDAVTAAAAAAITQPQPPRTPAPAPERDWWDELYTDQPAAAATDAAAQSEPETQPRRWMRIPPWWTGQPADLSAPEPETDDPDVEADEEDLEDDEADDLDYDVAADAAAGEPDAQPAPRSRRRQSKKRRPAAKPRSRNRALKPDATRALLDSPQPRRSLLDACDDIPVRIRWLTVHLTAAAAGYKFGWVDHCTRATAWIADHGSLNATAFVLYGVAIACESLRYSTRRDRLLIRWACAIPISSIVIGAALYGTGWTELELPL